MELDRNVPSALDLEDARWDVPVVCYLRIGIVVDKQNIELTTTIDHALEVIGRGDRGGRIVRVVEVKDARVGKHVFRNLVQLDEEIRARPQGIAVELGL